MPKTSKSAIDAFVGERLRALRKDHDLSQAELGKILSVTFQQVQKYERGHNRLSIAQMLELVRRFDLALDYFIPEARELSDRAKAAPVRAERNAAIELLRSADNLALLRAFNAIKDKPLRDSVLVFVRSLARKRR